MWGRRRLADYLLKVGLEKIELFLSKGHMENICLTPIEVQVGEG